jgi:hypothetical protein
MSAAVNFRPAQFLGGRNPAAEMQSPLLARANQTGPSITDAPAGSPNPVESYTPSETTGPGLMPTIGRYLADMKRAPLLERNAGEAKDAANLGMDSLLQGMGQLAPADKKSLGQSMFYQMAESSQLFSQGGSNMTSDQIRTKFTNISPEERQALESKVNDWSKNNQIPFQMAISQGAVGWAASNATPEESDRNKQLLGIAKSAQSVWAANAKILDSATALNDITPGRGSALYQQLNSPPADGQ